MLGFLGRHEVYGRKLCYLLSLRPQTSKNETSKTQTSKTETLKTQTLNLGAGYSQKNWVGVCGPLPKTLTLFMTKICDFPHPIYDLTKNLIPYL